MGDRDLRIDLERLRLAGAGLNWLDDDVAGGGVPAFLGRVTTAASLIGLGKFLMVQPTSVLGREVEGGPGQFTAVGSPTVPVYLVGPARPATGDYLVCKYVDNRWVAERSGGSGGSGGGGKIPGCLCDPIPATLTMTSGSTTCNYGMFQSCTIQYGPTPSAYSGLNLGANCYMSVQSFPDPIARGALFQYLLTCYSNQFSLSRVYAESPYGSPYRDGLLYSWLVGGYGNTCVPFHLDYGLAYAGSDASCFVTIDGA